MSDWFPLLAVIVSLVLLVSLERWIHQHLHGVALLATGSADAALLVYVLPILPGVVLHELSHWAVAWLLGVKTTRVTLLPRRQSNGHIQLGSVTIRQTDPVRASLIGAAPLVTGSLVTLLISHLAFGAGAVGDALQTGDANAVAWALAAALHAPDMWVWLYLLFAVANAMLPSPADRATWPPVILFLAVFVGMAYVLGLSNLLSPLAPFVVAGLRRLALAFGVTLAADLPFVILIALAEWSLGALRGQRVFYKKINRRRPGR